MFFLAKAHPGERARANCGQQGEILQSEPLGVTHHLLVGQHVVLVRGGQDALVGEPELLGGGGVDELHLLLPLPHITGHLTKCSLEAEEAATVGGPALAFLASHYTPLHHLFLKASAQAECPVGGSLSWQWSASN